MYAHHQRALERLAAELQDDPRYLALILGGSIAKGRERPDSDVDVLIVAAEEEFAERLRTGTIQYINRDLADWPGGYVEGKIVDRQWLRDVAERGSEPARAAFVSTSIVYSRIPDLAELLARIVVYPEAERAEKLAAFYSQVVLLTWFVPEAEKRQDAYLLSWATTNLALSAGRLILAHNRILFPYHKWFMYEVRRAPDKPADFLERLDAFLARPGTETAQALRDCVAGWRDWGRSREQAVPQFILENEWNWRTGRPSPADW